jgi:hypothetical protein
VGARPFATTVELSNRYSSPSHQQPYGWLSERCTAGVGGTAAAALGADKIPSHELASLASSLVREMRFSLVGRATAAGPPGRWKKDIRVKLSFSALCRVPKTTAQPVTVQ